jgi:hypothetical protein
MGILYLLEPEHPQCAKSQIGHVHLVGIGVKFSKFSTMYSLPNACDVGHIDTAGLFLLIYLFFIT